MHICVVECMFMHLSQRVSVNAHRWEIVAMSVCTWEKGNCMLMCHRKGSLKFLFWRFTEGRAIYEALSPLLSVNSWFLPDVSVWRPLTQFFLPFHGFFQHRKDVLIQEYLLRSYDLLKLFSILEIRMRKSRGSHCFHEGFMLVQEYRCSTWTEKHK